jgi:hypothetical protein
VNKKLYHSKTTYYIDLKGVLTMSRKFSVSLFLMLVFVFSVFSASAQVGLRRAMDQDSDGKADFWVFRPSNSVWYVNKSAGGINFQTFGTASTDYMAPGDYDGDGKGDIAIFRDTDGTWYFLRSSNGTIGGMAWGLTGDEPVARDYDGDGKTDFAIARRTGGNMVWYIFNSATQSFRAEGWGLATDYVAPGDYDGDGKYDLAIQRGGATTTSLAYFYINKSSGGYDIVGWGFTNDLVVPGDYDGDGKTDIAVVREGATPTSPLNWYIRKSSDGNLLGVTFGVTNTDLNVQNDYDGDGKCDPAVWRDSNGTFYIALSTTNYSSLNASQWGSSGDYPVGSYDTH